jgi:hypothetical protein
MHRNHAFRPSAIIFCGAALLPNHAQSQQNSLKEQLVGSWAYVSSTARRPDGSPLWGANPKGLMIFTENGHFSWQVFSSDRPKFASGNRMRGTADENTDILQGSLAYFGTYTVDEADKSITTRIEGSTFPNSEGEVQKRIISHLTADELTYENPATTRGDKVEALWKRQN